MKFLSDFFKAIRYCFRAFGILFEKGFWPYMFYPLLIWIVLWLLSFYGLFELSRGISQRLAAAMDLDSIPETGHWLSFAKAYLAGIFSFLVHLTVKLLFWFLGGTIIKYILLMILSPVFALLSEKTDHRLTGAVFPFSFLQLARDISRGIMISLRNMLMELLLILACFVATFLFPPLFFITTPFLFFVSWYYTGFALLDYNNERYHLSVRGSIGFVRQHRGYACGIGCVYWIFMALPFIPGSIIGMMFGPAIGIIGATFSYLEITGKKINQNPSQK